MRALVVKDRWLNNVDELSVSTIPVPKVDAGNVLVRIEAVGVNFFDTLLVTGKYQFKPAFPFIPGSEFAGVVVARASDVDDFNIGDRVFGGGFTGAYAEYISAPSVNIVRMPDRLSFEEACGIHTTYPTSYAALKVRANLQPGEVCLVHAGAGGVGMAAVQIAKRMGATVIATVGSDDKMDVVKRLGGADYAINYSKEDWIARVKEITDGNGVDVVYDPVGLVEESTKVIAWNGRILVIGFAGGKIPSVPVNRLLLKNCSVVGCANTNFMYFLPC